jgi:hypothetical protein
MTKLTVYTFLFRGFSFLFCCFKVDSSNGYSNGCYKTDTLVTFFWIWSETTLKLSATIHTSSHCRLHRFWCCCYWFGRLMIKFEEVIRWSFSHKLRDPKWGSGMQLVQQFIVIYYLSNITNLTHSLTLTLSLFRLKPAMAWHVPQ